MPVPAGATDDALAGRARRGDLEAFNALVERHQSAVYGLCLRLLGNREAAEDATQEAFISAYRSMARFEGGNVRSWLLRIGANEAKDELRRRRRKDVAVSLDQPFPGSDEAPDPADPGPGTEDLAFRDEIGPALEAMLLRLPYDQREAVVLVDVYDLPYEQAARAAGVSLGTLKSRIFRGRERLRALILSEPEQFAPRGRLVGKQ